MKVRFCFEITKGLATDDRTGEPAPCGMQVEMGEVPDEKYPGYEKLVAGLDMEAVVKSLLLEDIVDPADVRVITPEEYDHLYDGNCQNIH